ncbi:JAB domain-containing protein [Alkalihalophilus pseudofirmus]|uniref:JAB domain-containing protein n=1 Tax=Alkalihalophilus pseudofirmus TaxID=79885 RepID=UPI00030B9E1A|nr:JAB domain-containing protein [Alkalihalophilus pseudofirmus]
MLARNHSLFADRIEQLSFHEILRILVKDYPLVTKKINQYRVRELVNFSKLDFLSLGCNEYIAEQLFWTMQLCKKTNEKEADQPFTITSPNDIYECFKELRYLQEERFCVAFLNVKNHVILKKTISIGGLDSTLVDTRIILREALRVSAAKIVAVHNHPSGIALFSTNDLVVTKKLKSACDAVDIEFFDHVIIGDGTFSSLINEGTFN